MFTSRTFLRVSATAAGGFVASLYFDDAVLAQQSAQPQHLNYPPDAFIHIKPDGQIIIHVNRIEMGQGVHTALPIVLADELDADWSQVVPELAPAADVYKDPVAGFQFVGGSGSVAHSFQQYRELGAKMRAMLVAAAAERWKVMPAQCRTESSIVRGPAGQTAKYAELAERAARMPVPASVQLKKASEFRLIGTRLPRLDSRPKCDGSQKFGLDLDLPGMKVAIVAHPPTERRRMSAAESKITVPGFGGPPERKSSKYAVTLPLLGGPVLQSRQARCLSPAQRNSGRSHNALEEVRQAAHGSHSWPEVPRMKDRSRAHRLHSRVNECGSYLVSFTTAIR